MFSYSKMLNLLSKIFSECNSSIMANRNINYNIWKFFLKICYNMLVFDFSYK